MLSFDSSLLSNKSIFFPHNLHGETIKDEEVGADPILMTWFHVRVGSNQIPGNMEHNTPT